VAESSGSVQLLHDEPYVFEHLLDRLPCPGDESPDAALDDDDSLGGCCRVLRVGQLAAVLMGWL
jgi:hypothetical protein